MKPSPLLAGLLLAAFALPAPAQSPSLAEQTVAVLDQLSGGPHAGQRANHAKGLIAAGLFMPTPEAAAISKAPHFRRGVGVTVRFSTGSGLPDIPDAHPNGRPYGLALRFALPGGAYADVVGISHNGFPAATPEQFLGLLDAVAQSRNSDAKPAPIESFLASHPAALAFVQAKKPVPQSFATQSYYGVNAFEFINKEGASVFGRYQIVPVAGEHFLSDEEAASAAPDFLAQELAVRVAAKPAKFKVLLQIANKDDPVDDPTAVWPADRKRVELGTLSITRVLPEAREIERKLEYNPLNLPDGIRPSNDPVLLFRPAAYAVSTARRH